MNAPQSHIVSMIIPLPPPCTGMLHRRGVLSPSVTRAERNSTICRTYGNFDAFRFDILLLELVYFERFVTDLGS